MSQNQDNRFWRLLARSADISGVLTVMISVTTLALAAGIGLAAWILDSPVIVLIGTPLILIVGATTGAVARPVIARQYSLWHADCETISADVRLRFDGTELIPTEWSQRRTIRALRSGVSEHVFNTSYFENNKVIEVDVEFGGTVMSTTYSPSGTKHTVVEFDKVLMRGEEHRLKINRYVPLTAPDSDPLLSFTATHPTRELTLTVTFGAVVPKSCMICEWYSQESHRPIVVDAVRPDEERTVVMRRRHLKAGRKYGIVWDWPTLS